MSASKQLDRGKRKRRRNTRLGRLARRLGVRLDREEFQSKELLHDELLARVVERLTSVPQREEET